MNANGGSKRPRQKLAETSHFYNKYSIKSALTHTSPPHFYITECQISLVMWEVGPPTCLAFTPQLVKTENQGINLRIT